MRAHSIAQKGIQAIQEEKWEVAYQQADLALQLDPKNEQAWRIMARVYTQARMDRAIFYWQELDQRHLLTNEDRYYYLKLLLEFKRLDLAQAQWQALQLKKEGLSSQDVILGLNYFLLLNRNAEAIALLRTSLQKQDNREERLLLGELLLGSLQEENYPEGIEILEKLSRENDTLGIRASLSLLGFAKLPDALFDELSKRIRLHPLFTLNHELEVFQAEIRRKPKNGRLKIEKIFSEKAETLKRDEDRVLMGQWLNRQKAYDLTLKLISENLAKNSTSFLLLRLDAWAGLKNWTEILHFLDQQPLPLEPYLIELFRARSWKELQKTRESELAWDKTFHFIQYQPQALQYVGDYAYQIAAWSQAKRIFEQMARFPNYALASQIQLLHIAEKEENLPEIVSHLEQILILKPEMKDARNDLAYIRLLQNQKIDESLETVQNLVKADPTVLSYRSTLALAYLKKGNPKLAFKTYQGLFIDWKSASPVARWIFYLTLKTNREEDLAKRFEEQIKGLALRKVEWDLASLYQPMGKR